MLWESLERASQDHDPMIVDLSVYYEDHFIWNEVCYYNTIRKAGIETTFKLFAERCGDHLALVRAGQFVETAGELSCRFADARTQAIWEIIQKARAKAITKSEIVLAVLALPS